MFSFTYREHTHTVLVNSLSPWLDLESSMRHLSPGVSGKAFPGRLKWKKTHSESEQIVPWASWLKRKKETEIKWTPGLVSLPPDCVVMCVGKGGSPGRKTPVKVFLDYQLRGITLETNFWGCLWGSFILCTRKTDPKCGHTDPWLGSQIRQGKNKMNTRVHFSLLAGYGYSVNNYFMSPPCLLLNHILCSQYFYIE